MPRSPKEQAVIDEFSKTYETKQTPVWQQIECCVWGCDYGATSWTTRREADLVALHGEEAYAKRMAGSNVRVAAVEQNVIRREQFSAVPV